MTYIRVGKGLLRSKDTGAVTVYDIFVLQILSFLSFLLTNRMLGLLQATGSRVAPRYLASPLGRNLLFLP